MNTPTLAVAFALFGASAIASAGELGFSFQAAEIDGYAMMPGMGAGAAAADFDADGDVDLFLPTAAGRPPMLLRNDGTGQFTNAIFEVGLANSNAARVALWFDYDGDGDLDLAVGKDCFDLSCDTQELMVRLFAQQSDGGFIDVSNLVGLTELAADLNGPGQPGTLNHLGGMSAGDVNGDGLPDLYVAIWQSTAVLYLSPAGGFATRGDDGQALYGRSPDVADHGGGHWQALFHDFDSDGLADIYVNVDFTENQLYRNSGSNLLALGGLVDIADLVGVATPWNEMGLAAGDYDNDGDIDLYSTNIHDWQTLPGMPVRQNVLFRNDTVGSAIDFEEVAADLGVEDTDWGWGTTFFDANLDGHLDIAATNCYCQADACSDHIGDPQKLFLNDGNGVGFTDVSVAAGFNDTRIGSGLLAADFSGDGYLDLVEIVNAAQDANDDVTTISAARYLINKPDVVGPDRHIVVIPRMAGANSHALGGIVRLTQGGLTQTRLITAGTSYLSQEPARAHFGVDPSVGAYVTVEWPGGQITSYQGVPPGKVLNAGDGDLFFDSFGG